MRLYQGDSEAVTTEKDNNLLFPQGQGKIEVPPTAQPGVVPSIYTGHPSYAYPADKSYAEDRGYPGTIGFPAKVEGPSHYPGGAPSLGSHSGAPAPTGFPRLDSRGFVYWTLGPCGLVWWLYIIVRSAQELDVNNLHAIRPQDVVLTHRWCHVDVLCNLQGQSFHASHSL